MTRGRFVRVMLVLLVAIVLAVVLAPVLRRAREYSGPGPSSAFLSAYQAMKAYAHDHDGHLPLAESWIGALAPYVRRQDPFSFGRTVHFVGEDAQMAFFEPLGGADLDLVSNPGHVPLLFVSDTRSHGDLSALAPLGDVRRRHYVLFADGSFGEMPADWPRGPVTIVLRSEESP